MRISKARLKQIILEEYKKVLAEAHGLDAGDAKTLKKHLKKLQKDKEDKAVQKILKFLLKSNVKVKKTQDVTKMKKKKKTVKEQLRDTRDVNVVTPRYIDPRSAEEEADDIMRAQFGPDIDKMKKYDDGGRTKKDQEEAERMPLIRKKNRNVGLKGPTELNARAKKVKQSLEQFVYTMYRTQRIMGDDLTKEQARAFKVLKKQIDEVGYRIFRLVDQFKD